MSISAVSDRPSSHDAPSLAQRQNPRLGAALPVDVYSRAFNGLLSVGTRDVGLGGLCLETPSLISYSSITRVVLQLSGEALPLEACGRWQQVTPGDVGVLTGVAFRRPSPSRVAKLWEVILSEGSRMVRSLYGTPDFEDWSLDDLMGLCQASRLRRAPAGRWLYRRGHSESGEDSIFVVQRGRVSLRVTTAGGGELGTVRLGPGRVLGGMAVITDRTNAESAVSDSDCLLIEIPRQSYAQLLRSRPLLAERLAHTVLRAEGRRAEAIIAPAVSALSKQ